MTQRYLLDSSVLVNLTKRDTASRDKLLASIENGIVVHHCEPVVMEVISGARPGEDFIMQSRLDSFSSLPHDLHSDYRRAGMMYRDLSCVRSGIAALTSYLTMFRSLASHATPPRASRHSQSKKACSIHCSATSGHMVPCHRHMTLSSQIAASRCVAPSSLTSKASCVGQS